MTSRSLPGSSKRCFRQSRGRRWLSAIAGGALAFAAGCSLSVDANRHQCSTDADCAERGAAFEKSVCIDSLCQVAPQWSCLSKALPVSTLPGPFHVKLQAMDIVRQTPLAGVTGKLCRKIDVNCATPDATQVSDSAGIISLDVTAAFTGYVWLTRDDLMPGFYFFNPPVDRDTEGLTAQMAPPVVGGLLAQQVGVTLDPERGLVLLSSYDCQGKAAAGVSFKMDGAQGSSVFYAVAGLPNTTVTSTDSQGYGGFLNVSPGTISVTGQLEEDNRELGRISLLIRAGSISYSRMVPLGQ
jgi:hypothetical protein